MSRRIALILFLIFLLAGVFLHYQDFLQPGQSLYLANFDDPAPRFSFYPWLVESGKQIHRGHFPLWSNLEGAGFPLLANFQSAPFNPFNLVFELFPSLRLLDYLLLLKIILLGIFTYLFAIELGLSPVPAAASALIICFSGYVSRTINQVNLNTEIWLPAGLVLIEKILKNRAGLIRLILLGIVTALALLGGNPEAAFYFLLTILLYAIFRAGLAGKKELLFILLGFCLGFLLSSAQILSFIEYLGFGWHIHTNYLHTIGRPPIRWAFSLFFPWIFGPARTHTEQLFTLSYLGLIPVLLATFTLVKIPKLKRSALFFWIYILVFLAIIYRIPPATYLSYLPILNRVASAKFACFGVSFGIGILAGVGLDFYLKNQLGSRRFGISLGLVAVLIIGSLILAFKFPFSSEPQIVLRAAWLYPIILLLIAAIICLYGIFFEEFKLTSALLAFLALINLLYLAPGLRPDAKINPGQWKFTNPAVPRFLYPLNKDRSARFTALEGVFHHNLNLIYRLNDLRVFEGMYPKDYVRTIAEIEGFSMEDAVEQFFLHGWSFDIQAKNLGHPRLNRLGVKFIISPKELRFPAGQIVTRADNYYIYQNLNAYPRVWLQQDNREIFKKVSLSQNKPDLVKVALNINQPADLILADQYAPGWRAFRLPSGDEIKISKYQGIFRKVPLQPDDRFIIFIYQPVAFRIGILLSIISILSLILFPLFKLCPKNNP